MNLNIPEYILSIKPYKPGKPLEELEREYGVKNSIKLASNENPLGPSPKAVAALQAAISSLHRYPDGSSYLLINKLADTLGVSPGQIVLGNGSDDVIGMLAKAYLKAGNEAVMTAPSFLMYEIFVRSVGATPVFVPLKSLAVDLDAMLSAISPRTRMIFLNNPNNPTGTFLKTAEFDAFLSRLPEDVVVVMDEAYIEFAQDPDCVNGLEWIQNNRPLAVLRTFSKIYGLAGIRIGYGVLPSEMASLLNRIRQPFNVNSLAQAAAIGALDDDEFLNKTKALVHEELSFMQAHLKKIGVEIFPTQANFFLIDVKGDADAVFDMMLREGVIVRSMVSYGYPQYIRVNAGLRKENIRFLSALEKVLKAKKGHTPMKKLVITIDGPAGAGKTTVSKALADRLGYVYVDTGALYRGVAYEALKCGISAHDDGNLEKLCGRIDLRFERKESGTRLFSGNSDITDYIRTPEMSMMASAVSARPVVRRALLDVQRKMGEQKAAVFEGRDMGTVVFPDADIKFFLTADLKARAFRRYQELAGIKPQPLENVEKEMKQRDENDSNREIAPLKPANDAILIDSSNIPAEAVIEKMMIYIQHAFSGD